MIMVLMIMTMMIMFVVIVIVVIMIVIVVMALNLHFLMPMSLSVSMSVPVAVLPLEHSKPEEAPDTDAKGSQNNKPFHHTLSPVNDVGQKPNGGEINESSAAKRNEQTRILALKYIDGAQTD